MCQSFCSRGGGGCLPHCMLGYTNPTPYTKSRPLRDQKQTPPGPKADPSGTKSRPLRDQKQTPSRSKADTPRPKADPSGTKSRPPDQNQTPPRETATTTDGTHYTEIPVFQNIFWIENWLTIKKVMGRNV